MTTVRSYAAPVEGLHPMGLIKSQLKLKDGTSKQLQVDLASLRAALSESGGVGLLAMRIPGRNGPILAAVCGREADPATGKISCIALKQVTSEDMVRLRVGISIEELPDVAKKGKAVVVQQSPGIAVQARVAVVQQGISIDLSEAGIGDNIKAGDFELPQGMSLMCDPDEVILRVEAVGGKPA